MSFKASALRALVPEASIDFLVDRYHVRKPIADLQDDLLARFEAACETVSTARRCDCSAAR